MRTRPIPVVLLAAVGLVMACGEPVRDAIAPSYAAGGVDRPAVLVNPNSNGNGTARTIQAGIDMVDEGGKVLVLPGTYDERIVIDKRLTLEGIGGESGPVIIEQVLPASAGTGTVAVVSVTTQEQVVIRNVTVHHVHLRGLNAFTAADLTIEHVSFRGEFPTPGATTFFNNGVSVVNNATQSGGRARLVIRNSDFQTYGIAIAVGGDLDGVIERNVIDHTASNTGCVFVSPTGQGVTVPAGAETNVDIVDNELIDCGAVVAGKLNFAISIPGVVGATTRGTVNIIGNTIRNSTRLASSCNAAGINYQFYTGRIEHNTFTNVTQSCAIDVAQARPAAIWLGTRTLALPAVQVTVRFNDFQGNAFAGLRLGPNQTVTIDATCNWWGSASGPSGLGSGTGDAVAKEGAAATPLFTPFAPAAIAGTDATGC